MIDKANSSPGTAQTGGAGSSPTGRGAGEPSSSATEAKQQAEVAMQEAKSGLRDAADDAREKAHGKANEAHSGVAQEIDDFGCALRDSASRVKSGSAGERILHSTADAVLSMSSRMEGKDVTEWVGDLSHFARRNPAVFLGGAAMLGFAASRFAKASDRPPADAGATAPDRRASDPGARNSFDTRSPVAEPPAAARHDAPQSSGGLTASSSSVIPGGIANE